MPSGTAPETLYLVDAHSLIFQVFHAIRGMSSPSGLPTNALFGFVRDMLHLRQDRKPTYLVCVFDVAGPTFRDHLYADYKANRAPAPDDLQLQFPLIDQALEGLRIPVLGVTGYEADDVLATVARAAAARGVDVYLCSSDKDCRQLIDDRVRVYNLRKHQVYDRDSLKADWGIAPEQVIDYQTLVGDSVDNVPGVPGIGEKTASRLLQEYGDLERLLEAARQLAAQGPGAKKSGSLTPRLAANLLADPEKVKLSRTLVRLATDVPVNLDWDAWRLREWDAPRLLPLFQQWGFRGFAEQVRSSQPAEGPVQGELFSEAEMFPFGANVAEPPSPPAPLPSGERREELPPSPPLRGRGAGGEGEPWQATYQLVDTPKEFAAFLRQLRKQKRFAVDLETTGLDPLRSAIVGFAVCWKPGEAWYLPVRGPEGSALLDPGETLAALRPVLEDAAVAKINQNIKYDLLVLRQHGVTVAGIAGDSMVADYLLHAGERSHNLEELARRYLHHQVTLITDLIGKKGKSQLRMNQVPTDRVAHYAAEDADVAWRLCDRLEPDLAACGLAKLYADLEVPLIEVLADLEFTGVRVDVPFLRRLSEDMTRTLAGMEREIHEIAGRPFNIASPKQLRTVLFDELKLPKQRRTGITGEASTNQETLERLAMLGHPLPKKILEHRQLAKLKGTYVDALPDLVNPDTGRIHASFNQTVTATGRLSSSEPNLQNVPVRRDQGRQIRQAFLPEEGWQLLTADYSQIELRLLAHFCGDAELRRAFAEDRDIHALVAAQVFGVPEAEVTAEMRRMAKTVNFGVIYGISAHGLAPRLSISREEASRFIDAYFARYPKVLEYQARLLADCKRTGFVWTILGRRRAFDGTAIRSNSTYQQRNQTEREAINMEIQGSAADLIKMAMLNIHRRLRRERRRTRMLLQIHDELVFETPPEELIEVSALVREEMTGPLEKALKLEVPLKVDLAAGPNWLDVEDILEPQMSTDEHR